MSASDFIPSLTPQSWQQLGVNTIYAATAGALVARQFDIPVEYGVLGAGGAYAFVGLSNSSGIIASQLANEACRNLEGVVGVQGACQSVKDLPSNIERWWERVVEGKSLDDVYGKGSSQRKGNDPKCALTKENLQDPTYWQRCYGIKQ